MRIIFWYLLRRQIELFLMCFAGLATFILVLDFLEHLRELLLYNADARTIFTYLAWRIPELTFRVFPLATLIAVLLSFGMLVKGHEITAMRACGMSLYQIGAPFFVFGLAVTVIVLSLTAFIIPISKAKEKYMYYVVVKKQSPAPCCAQHDLWFQVSSGTLLHVERIESAGSILRNVQMFRLDSEFHMREVTFVETMQYTRRGWDVDVATRRRLLLDGTVTLETYDSFPLKLALSPEDVWLSRTPLNMTLPELSVFIDRLTPHGHSVLRWSTHYWERITFPLTGGIVSILGVALVFLGAGSRSASVAKRLGQGLGILGLCLLIHSWGIILGRSGALMPVVAASAGTVLLFAVSLALFLKARQI